jgi:hypothetical protein
VVAQAAAAAAYLLSQLVAVQLLVFKAEMDKLSSLRLLLRVHPLQYHCNKLVHVAQTLMEIQF